MRYDAIIIGSGQGANPLAYGLVDRGLRVALIEKEHLGGTCINVGCTPTKTMVHSAQVAHYARNAARWGVRAGNTQVDLPAIVARKRQIVERFRAGHQRKVEERENLRLYRGHGRFVGPRTVEVNGERLEAERIFISAGTRPDVPRIEGLDRVPFLTNASMMELQEVPGHLIVLGAGYVGVEFGQMFRRFGAEVTIIHRGDRLLTREDPDIAAALQKALEAEGIQFLLNAETTRVEQTDSGIALDVLSGTQRPAPSTQRRLTGSHLLVATGRRPNSDDLGLETAGVETDPKGFVKVNERLETSAPGVWAMGDVKGGPAFTHISWNDYQIVWANLIEGKNETTEGRPVPYAVFTDPQLGRVGMTEAEARATGKRLKIGTIPMSGVARAIERDETAGLMKLIVDAETDRVLGAAILGTEGGELIQNLGTLMLAGAPYTLLKGAIYIHPTLAEGFYSLMDAVSAVD
jgi:pyruvate/2-oxoglutarate dehydrogenase complex dihydrolipoamide dehydrogenase (E3) component